MKNLVALTDILDAAFRHQSSADWLERLEAIGVPAGPVLDVAAMHSDPQTLARGMVAEVDHSRVGPVKTIGLPIKFSATPGGVRAGAPTFGEHGRAILGEHGFDAAAIERLARDGAVHLPDRSAATQR
jgi:crotonobetainyl-CoA:carnitine CoA-transferase CaiB-like acyl-CoA transferase